MSLPASRAGRWCRRGPQQHATETFDWRALALDGRREIMSIIRPNRSRRSAPTVESLEGRALMSGPGHAMPAPARPALVHRVHTSIRIDPGGYSAILSALNGGLGSEWVKLIHAEVHNLSAVIGGFVSGKYTAYSIPGLAAKTPNVQPQFAGQPYDQLLANVAGGFGVKGKLAQPRGHLRGAVP